MKKNNNLFRIGEVASFLGISRKMILNYEKHGIIVPSFVDSSSGYRYFDSYTIARIQIILDLRKTDMSLKDIEKYLNGRITTENQIAILNEQIKEIKKAISRLEIRNKSENIKPEIKQITLPAAHFITRYIVAKDINDAITSFTGFFEECMERGIHFSRKVSSFCEFEKDLFDKDFYQMTDISMKMCICIDEKRIPEDAELYPEGKVLLISYCGEYGKSYTAYETIKKYIQDNHIEVKGYPREVYMEGNFDNSSNKNIVLIVVPIK
ncbi:MAG: MerR family transcriptional regulator [Bacillales bacterium]|nr:MerR family transcriptional regulator [Bacillales bacterium]